MNTKAFTYIYLAIGILHILSRILPGEWTWLHYITKPMIMISLGAFVWWQEKSNWNKNVIVLLLAILASLGGDILLMLPGNFFVFGLGSFLLAHIFYMAVFNSPSANGQVSILKQKSWLLIPFVLYVLGFLWILAPNLGGLLVPVCIYAIIIALMAISALNRRGRVSNNSFKLVFWGAILFVISDSFIAMNKFVVEIPLNDLWVMLTYITAQYLIIFGLIEEFELKKQKIVELTT